MLMPSPSFFTMSRANAFALVLVLLAILFSGWVSLGVYEGLAQLEDEYAYQWQAQILSRGDLKIPSPPQAHEFVVPFVIDYHGERFSKYPLGWPVVLSFGERLGLAHLVNSLLAGLCVWLTYRLGAKLLGEKVGLLAAGLTLISPLFLTYTGSILSHTWGLALSLVLAVSWLDVTGSRYGTQGNGGPPTAPPGWLPVWVAGLSLGVLALTRPWTALGVGLPFGIHGIIRIWRGPENIRIRILAVGAIALLVGSVHFLWQFALTGDPLLNPYLLWWPYDKVGFGPGIGIAEGGHSPYQGWVNTKNSLRATWQDLWGWGRLSWLLLPVGLWGARRQPKVWLVASVFPSLVLSYLVYWVSGPRYFYEGLYSLTITCAAVIAWFLGWMPSQEIDQTRGVRMRQGFVWVGLSLLILFGTIPYTPSRLNEIKDRYGFTQAALDPFRTPEARELTPALIIVHTARWWDYGPYLNLQDPYLTTPFIFAWAAPTGDPLAELASHFPGRSIYHYYPEQPGAFFTRPLP